MTSRFNKNQTTTFVPKKSCRFCVERGETIDYKDPKNIQKYVSSSGKIEPRKKTGLCLKHQRKVSKAIKRARAIALFPFVNK